MKKPNVRTLTEAQFVVAHAAWRASRGRKPSMAYLNERDPRRALAFAKFVSIKPEFANLIYGTADHVVAHAKWRAFSGLPPMMPYLTYTDPVQALKAAESIRLSQSYNDLRYELLQPLMNRVLKGKRFKDMTDEDIQMVAQRILRESSSGEEAQRRFRDDLGYPYGDVSLSIELPTDQTGREARDLVRALGGTVMKNGAMVMGMMHGHNGIIFL